MTQTVQQLLRQRQWEECLERLSGEEGKVDLQRWTKVNGHPPLTAALELGAPLAVVRAICACGVVWDEGETTALGMALGVGNGLDGESTAIILEVLKANPEAAAVRTLCPVLLTDKMLPLHLALWFRCSVSVIRAVGRAYPAACQELMTTGKFHNRQSDIPLHLECRLVDARTEEYVRALLELDAASVAVRSRTGDLALHLACQMGQSMSVIEELVQADLSSVAAVASDNELAFHKALRFHAADVSATRAATMAKVALYLLSIFPEAAKRPHATDVQYSISWTHQPRALSDLLPLHRAVGALQPCKDLILKLLSIYPAAAQMPTKNGQLPLHYMCQAPATARVFLIQTVLQAHPPALQTPDSAGFFPLHRACQSKDTSMETLSYLLELASESLYARNQEGNSPLHIACANYQTGDRDHDDLRPVRFDIHQEDPKNDEPSLCDQRVRRILQADPQAARRQNKYGVCPAMLLYERLSRNQPPNPTTLRLLLQSAPEALFLRKQSGFSMMDHLFMNFGKDMVAEFLLATYAATPPPPPPWSTPLHEACRRLVRFVHVLRMIHELFPEAVKTRDATGNLPLHLVCQQCARQSPQEGLPCQSLLMVLRTLMGMYGEALYLPDAQGRVPFVAAVWRSAEEGPEGNVPMDVLYLLLREDPTVLEHHWEMSNEE